MLVSYLGNNMSKYTEGSVTGDDDNDETHQVSTTKMYNDRAFVYHVAYVCICLLGATWDLLPFDDAEYGPFWFRYVSVKKSYFFLFANISKVIMIPIRILCSTTILLG